MSSAQNSECKRKRRKRNDQATRDFVCKCGKAYLSYPALYTHIKTKHQDQPIKISKLLQNGDSQIQIAQKIQKINSKQKQNQQIFPLYSDSLSQVNNIEALKQFLFKYFPNVNANTLPNYKNQLTTNEKLDLKQMKQYWINRVKQDEQFNETYQTPLYLVLGKFINELQDNVHNYSFKRFIYTFIFTIKRALQKIKDQDYFKKSTASQLPTLFNQILNNYFLVDKNDYLSNPTVAVKSIYYLSRWLYVQKFTNFSLKFNF